MERLEIRLKPHRLLGFFIHHRQPGEFAGGTERRFLEVAKCFACFGLKVYALELKPPLKNAWIKADYSSLAVSRKSPKRALDLLSFVLYLSIVAPFLCKRLSCNIVYATRHELPENVIPAYLTSRLCGIPLIIVFNAVFKKDRLRIRELLANRLRKGFNPISALWLTLLDFVMRIIYRKAEACIAVSPTLKKQTMKNLKVQEVFVSGNGVNLGKFEPRSDVDEIYEAAFLGRIHPSKGIQTLLRAWKLVTEEVSQAKLMLIGDGVKETVNGYKLLVKRLHLEKNVIFTGFRWRDEEITALLTSSKIFVFPSLVESFGISVAEAMACGLPCIVTDIPALRNNFDSYVVFVAPHNVESLASAIFTLLKDEEKRKNLGLKGRKYVRKFRWESVAQKELKVFEKVAKLIVP